MKRFTLAPLSFVLLLFASIAFAMPKTSMAQQHTPVFALEPTPMADSLIETLSLREKIGQLFMVAAYSNRDAQHVAEIEGLIKDYGIGGLIFMQGGPVRQAALTNRYQELSEVPLLLSMDAEWGLGMRLDSVLDYPRQMALGASYDGDVVYQFGREQARQLKRLGVHVSFSPVVDVNSNPDNPVIGNRAFGEEREHVAQMGVAYMSGLQDGGVLANAKHFPGHGDTDSDSHKTLPSILHSRERLDSIELYPFRRLFSKGAGSVMVAHLNIPSLDSTGRPSTLSRSIVTDLLRNELGFDGLVFTDALNMAGVANFVEPGDAEYEALLAGNDVLLFAGDVPRAVRRIEEAVLDSTLSEAIINEHCLRILRAKEWTGALKNPFVELEGLEADLNNASAQAIQRRVVESSLTVLRNQDILPFRAAKKQRVAVLNIGDNEENAYTATLRRHMEIDVFSAAKNPSFSTSQRLEEELSGYDLVIVNLLDASSSPSRNWGVTNQSVRIINAINAKTKVLVNLFTNPYALRKMLGIEKVEGLLVAYHDNAFTQKIAAEVLAGAATAKGRLPVSAGAFLRGEAMPVEDVIRLRETVPEYVGLRTEDLARIDSIVQSGLDEQAYPGCRVLVVKEGNIIVDRSYGHQTYKDERAVGPETVYDLASITKIVASTAALMRLQDEGKFSLDFNICDYLEVPDTSSCFNMNMREMLSHYARLPAWIPFYLETIKEGELNPGLYRKRATRGFTTKVAENLYIRDSYADTIFTEITLTALRPQKEYRYSDLGYYFIQRMIERLSGKPLEVFVDSVFYSPMGLTTMGYHPLERVPLENIAPTEYDMFFRKQLVHGYVHDPGAAMMGGVGGHAGVFSSAYDLAVMMQMFMNGGTYGGERYINDNTLAEYTTCHYCDQDNRRGVGFDKPALEPDSGPTCNDASPMSFGHSGFTGTLAWADPAEELVYVFLSNRVYPNAENRKLIRMDIRTEIQQVIYDAIRAEKTRRRQEMLGNLGKQGSRDTQ
jgi:beta-glucosidase-like glycosyl hydrolase/CubicO group peptidase (beta-lactamase class C family)